VDVEERAETTVTAGEREQLESFVHDQRVEIINLLEGLDDEQARRRLVPSATTVLGLVKHASFVERVWFDVAFAGRTRAEVGIPDASEDSFVLSEDDTVASVRALYRRAWDSALEIAAGHDLDDVALHNRRSPVSLRWIYLHLVRELARHAGHGDILREQILAADRA
jgi:hypothetical protein